jgi:asparagine synthase (glutamine-hydrolysing)
VQKIREAIEIRLVSEVPLGAFLSGGVDSSTVVALMAELSEEPVNTCSIAFGEREFNESEYARAVAERYRCSHRVEHLDPYDHSLIDILPALYDEPFADSSAMPTYRVCELAAREVTVVLSGDGGDENLAGYRRYEQHLHDLALKSRMPNGLRGALAGLGRLYPDSALLPDGLRRRQGLLSLGHSAVDSFFEINSVMKRDLRRSLYSRSFRQRLQGYDAVSVFRRHAARADTDDPLSLAQYLDLKTYLPGDILTKVDRASMAHSIEVRVPLLDHQLVEWTASLPASFKRHEGEGKYLLKKSMETRLPKDILYRPKKGFAVPLAEWFRGPLRQRLLTALGSETLQSVDVFDRRALTNLFNDHDSGRRDCSAALWSILMFEAFLSHEAA